MYFNFFISLNEEEAQTQEVPAGLLPGVTSGYLPGLLVYVMSLAQHCP